MWRRRNKTGGGKGSNQYRIRGRAKRLSLSSYMQQQWELDRRCWQANNVHASRRVLASLATDPDPEVRLRLAQNTKCPPQAVAVLAKDEDAGIRRNAAVHQACPLDTLMQLAKDEDTGVRYYVTLNPACPPQTLAELALDNDQRTREGAREMIRRRSDIPEHYKAMIALSE